METVDLAKFQGVRAVLIYPLYPIHAREVKMFFAVFPLSFIKRIGIDSTSHSFFNSREAIAAIIGDIVVFFTIPELDCVGALSFFLQFKEFELYWGAVFFLKICSHVFMIFEVKLEW